MLWIWLLAATVVLLGLVLHWLFVTTEGTYLGCGVVILLYDWTAARYDAIKNLYFVNEARYLGIPLVEALATVDCPWVLDVATGTGRMPLALLREADFRGMAVGIDRSMPMLAKGRTPLQEYGQRVALSRQDAASLAFADQSFDAVTCLEAMEFMIHPLTVLAEMERVLKPGGLALISNRVGPEARFFPGRMSNRGRLEEALKRVGMVDIVTERWQVHYDLVWARKPVSGTLLEPASGNISGSVTKDMQCRKT